MRRSLFGLALVCLLALPVHAQDEDPERPSFKSIPADRLSCTVQGYARVLADQIEVEVVVQAQGDDGDTAEKKHRDKLKKVQAALERLKATYEGKEVAAEKPSKKRKKKAAEDDEETVPRGEGKDGKEGKEKDATDDAPDPPSFSIELREGRSAIGVSRGAVNADGTPAEGPVTVATAVLLKMKGISGVSRPKLRKRLAQILDTAIEAGADSGASGGSRPAFRFRARDNEELRMLAQEDALKKGKARAKRLADLAGRELGALKAIGETGWMLRSGSTDQVGFDSVIGKIGNNKQNNYEMTTSTSEIELECELTLEFELGKPVEPPAAAAEPAKKK